VAPVPAAWAKACAESPCVAEDALRRARLTFTGLVQAAAAFDLTGRIAFVDAAVNRLVARAADTDLGAVDVWLTPYETLARGRGDCEDVAIAKYFVLRASGTAPGDARLLYARVADPDGGTGRMPHVVALARHPYADPYVLDNRSDTPRPVSARPDLDAVFSFDRSQIWVGASGARLDRHARELQPWCQVLDRTARQAAH
jgi:predicted transglutaminase-like cysteine proteinase